MALDFHIERENVTFWLRVKPRAARERFAMDSAGELRLELHAPASEGRANEACVLFLARSLKLPQACVVILSGHKSRRKLIRITGRSAAETVSAIKRLAGIGDEKPSDLRN